jgi:hypothetical protein
MFALPYALIASRERLVVALVQILLMRFDLSGFQTPGANRLKRFGVDLPRDPRHYRR